MVVENRFKTFLKEGQPFGDIVDRPFVYDALQDEEFPDPQSWEELEGYIRRRNPDAPPRTLKAAQHLWQRYTEER